MSTASRLSALLLAGAPVLITAVPAFAQDEAAAGTPGEEIVQEGNAIIVTATLREATLQDVPVAVSVISGESLDQAGVTAVDALVDVAPSLTFTKGSNEQNSSLSIRGVGTTVFTLAAEPSTSVVVDGVVLARAGMGFQDLVDIERVEVLRGPQSTLFGMNASAGVVSVTTKAPSRDLSGMVDALVTEDGEFRLRGMISGPLSDNAGIRLSGFRSDYDGSGVNFFNGDRINTSESWGLRGRVDVEPTDALSLSFIADYRKSDATPISTITEYTIPARESLVAPVAVGPENTDVNADGDIFSKTEQWGVSAKADYTFGNDYTLTSITAYREWTFDNNVDVDNTSQPVGTPNLGFVWNVNRGTTALSQVSQEVRLASPEWESFDFLIGAFFMDLDIDRTFSRRWVFTPSAAVPTGGRSSQFSSAVGSRNIAGFVSGNFHPSEDLTIFGGVRLLQQKLDWYVFRDPTNVLVAGDVPLTGAPGTYAGGGTDPDFDGTLSDTALIGNIGVRYEVGDYGNVYASYSRGYKAGAFDAEFGSTFDLEPVKPEESNAFEIGLKMSTLDRVLTANIALFYTKYKNYQGQARDPNDIAFRLTNAGEVSTRGVETEFALRPTDNLNLSLGAAWIDAKIDKFLDTECYVGQTAAEGCENGVQNLSGATLPNSPEWKFTASARQTIPLETLPFDAFIQANGSYQSEVQFALSQDPRAIQKGYALLNAAVGIEDKDGYYSFQVFGRNLTDQFYAGELFPSTLQGGRITQNVARGSHRYFGVQGTVRF